jgi:hypothetical protein
MFIQSFIWWAGGKKSNLVSHVVIVTESTTATWPHKERTGKKNAVPPTPFGAGVLGYLLATQIGSQRLVNLIPPERRDVLPDQIALQILDSALTR